jgi:hypothetical protein
MQRSADLQAEAGETDRAGRHRGDGDGRGRTAEHRRPPNGRQRDAGGLRDRVEHHAFQRALPQLARQQPAKELLLVAGGPAQQAVHELAACGRRARPGQSRRRLQRRIDLDDGEGRLGGRWGSVAERGPADPGPALAWLAGQPRHENRRVLGAAGPQQVGQPGHLRRPGARRGDVA